MTTRNSSRVVEKINQASPTAQGTVASIKDFLSANLNTKVYELPQSTVARLRKDTSQRWFIVATAKPYSPTRGEFNRYKIYPETLDVPQQSRLFVTIVSMPKRYQIEEVDEIFLGETSDVYLNPEMLVLIYS